MAVVTHIFRLKPDSNLKAKTAMQRDREVCANITFRWQRKALLFHFYIAYTRRFCASSPRAGRVFRGAAGGRPRLSLPSRAIWSECRSSYCRSARRRTRTLRSPQTRCPAARIGPSDATTEGNSGDVSRFDKSVEELFHKCMIEADVFPKRIQAIHC